MVYNKNFNRTDKDKPINYRIRATQVVCIDKDGNNLGTLTKEEAINKAKEQELDLVLIADGQQGIPVCKILDYGKFKYEQTKKRKESEKKNREAVIKIKELKFRPTTDINDLRTKANKASEFLADGDKVKVFIIFRGREITHREVGMQTLNKFLEMIPNAEFLDVPSMQGKVLSATLGKKKEAKAS